MISIGVVYGGPEQRGSALYNILSVANTVTIEVCGEPSSGKTPSVNVVFYVEGSVNAPNWDGLRDGTFSEKDMKLMVQVAVPNSLVDGDGAVEFLIDALHGANAIAFDVFDEQGMQYLLREAEVLVEKIKAGVQDSLG